MPQATDELRAKFPGDDSEALEVIEQNFIVDPTGVVHPKVENYEPTDREDNAIDYLFQEWDYGYDPAPYRKPEEPKCSTK